LLDLNDFKVVNDTWGHLVGDQVLCRIARRLQQTVRTGDTVARLGGDEFALLLPGSGEEEAHHVVERVRARVSVPCRVSGHSARVGCSVGLAFFPVDGADAETLLHSADLAMYRVKRANATGLGQPKPPPTPFTFRTPVR